jgi:tRNA (cmo5U34)-methyltransferase
MGPQSLFRIGNLALDREGRRAWLGAEEVSLTYQEFEVLSLLLAQQNVVISHLAICRAIWGAAGPSEIKRLGVVISNLRKKLERMSPYMIETVRSRGYGIVLGESATMTSSDPIGMHDWHSHRYAHEWIDRQDDDSRVYLRHITHLLPFDPEDDIRVLDIGAGYGALTRLILDAFPHSRVVVHDYAEPMLRQARDYLSAASDAVTFVRGDLLDENWHRDISGGFDAVVSSIAIHNVRRPGRIRAIYRDVFSLVSPGGCFFNVDYVTPSAERVRQARRHQQLMEQRYQLRRSTGVWQPIAEVERQVAESSQRDNSHGEVEQASLGDHLSWLAEAGFGQVECFWHDGRRALVGGFRDAGRSTAIV